MPQFTSSLGQFGRSATVVRVLSAAARRARQAGGATPRRSCALAFAAALTFAAAPTASAATIGFDRQRSEYVLVAGSADNTLTIDPLEQAVQLTLTGEPILALTGGCTKASASSSSDSVTCVSPTQIHWGAPYWPRNYWGNGGVTRLKVSMGGGNDTVTDSPTPCVYDNEEEDLDRPICYETDLSLTVLGEDGDDRIDAWTLWWSWLDGGAGTDQLVTHRGYGREELGGWFEPSTSLGGDGNDTLTVMDFKSRTEMDYSAYVVVRGGAGADTFKGSNRASRFYGGPGVDTFSGGSGGDRIDAQDGGPSENVSCGQGGDTAYVDVKDKVGADCEHVYYP